MTVMANDFVPIKPYETGVVTLGVGQRTDVIVEAKLPAGSAVFMRSFISGNCSTGNKNSSLALAVIYYDGADPTSVPTSVATPFDDSHCGNDPLDKTIPFFPFPATQTPETTVTIGITFHQNATKHWLWYMNESSFRANYDHPILLLANQGNTSYPFNPEWNVYNFGNNNSVRVIVENHIPAAHPMHLHGHNFNVLSEGPGTWNGTINHIENTQRRDVQLLQPSSLVTGEPSHLVIQYNTDNSGVWPFHCHIAWHVSAGLYVNLMEQTDLITKRVIPSTIEQNCHNWRVYSGSEVVDEIDSGL